MAILAIVVVVAIVASLLVPFVLVFDFAAIAFPVAVVIHLVFVAWRHPGRATLCRARVVAFMPLVVVAHWIPITGDPTVFGARTGR